MDHIEFNQFQERVDQVSEYLNVLFPRYKSRYSEGLLMIEEAAERIVGIYAEVIYPRYKVIVPDKVNVYKIAASHEQAIIKVQPFNSKEFSAIENREVNAELAFNVAMTNIECMWDACGGNPDDKDSDKSVELFSWQKAKETSHPRTINHAACDNALDIGRKEHLEWLTIKDPNEYHIHTVASFLRMYYVFQQQSYAF